MDAVPAMQALADLPVPLQTIVWLYLLTNAARIFSYMPQIHAVWVSRDGAHAISLLTWGSLALSHAAALAYALCVTHDAALAAISCINLGGCSTITVIAARRRRAWRRSAPALARAH